ncbi:winged helix-turn-helix domain-containing protein [Corallococcus sicarius]|uniref:winged helix-turn-helix domain-containing protein n=1 Tax=Corallococcus sicarius TaxID=2316726 RepID=UPI0034E0B45D
MRFPYRALDADASGAPHPPHVRSALPPHYLAECLHRLGLSPQQPRTRAKERDDALVEAWLKRDWPRIKRGLEEAGGPLPSWTRQVVRFGPA